MDAAMCAMMNGLQWRRRHDAIPREVLADYIERHRVMDRAEFYAAGSPAEIAESAPFLEWHTPLPGGFAENNRARIRFFRAANPGAPCLLLLHALMSASDVGYRSVAARFNRRGWHVAFPHLPYHYSRTPRGTLNGELAITADLIRNGEGLRQAVVELRQFMHWARETLGTREFAVLGTSYGGWIGALLSFLEPDFRFVALVQPIVNVEKAIWENPGAAVMRSRLRALGHEPGLTRDHARLVSPLDGLPLCRNVLVTCGEYDLVSPPQDLEELVRRWPGAELLRVRQGHFGYTALRETLERLEPHIAQEKAITA